MDLLPTILTPFAWLLNGLLAILYGLVLHWQPALLVPALGWLAAQGPTEHRPWAVGIAALVLPAGLLAPQPAPALLLVMSLAAGLGMLLERFNPASLHWRLLNGLALYALLGLGAGLFQFYLERLAGENLLLLQGQAYVGLLAEVALYGLPVGYLALLAQGLLVHPPIPGGSRPETLLHTLRARNED